MEECEEKRSGFRRKMSGVEVSKNLISASFPILKHGGLLGGDKVITRV
jgi:hypothetical protein